MIVFHLWCRLLIQPHGKGFNFHLGDICQILVKGESDVSSSIHSSLMFDRYSLWHCSGTNGTDCFILTLSSWDLQSIFLSIGEHYLHPRFKISLPLVISGTMTTISPHFIQLEKQPCWFSLTAFDLVTAQITRLPFFHLLAITSEDSKP